MESFSEERSCSCLSGLDASETAWVRIIASRASNPREGAASAI